MFIDTYTTYPPEVLLQLGETGREGTLADVDMCSSLLLILLWLLVGITSGGDVLYVDQFANDKGDDCGAKLTPCRNITTALKNVQSDFSIIKVCPGSYLPIGDVSNLTVYKYIQIEGRLANSSTSYKNSKMCQRL